jgi:hypothetical protein
MRMQARDHVAPRHPANQFIVQRPISLRETQRTIESAFSAFAPGLYPIVTEDNQSGLRCQSGAMTLACLLAISKSGA